MHAPMLIAASSNTFTSGNGKPRRTATFQTSARRPRTNRALSPMVHTCGEAQLRRASPARDRVQQPSPRRAAYRRASARCSQSGAASASAGVSLGASRGQHRPFRHADEPPARSKQRRVSRPRGEHVLGAVRARAARRALARLRSVFGIALVLAFGAASRHVELVRPSAEKLGDAEWRARLSKGSVVVPAWSAGFHFTRPKPQK